MCVIYNVFTVYCTKSHLYTHNCTHTQSKIIPLPVHVSLLLGTGGDRGIDVYGLTIENNKRTYGHIKYWTKCYRHTLSVS